MDQRLVDLFNNYTHGGMSRRTFLDRFTVLAGGAAAASTLLPLLDYNYAQAATVAESDPRIGAETVDIPGITGLKGYLVTPKSAGPHGSVVVIHENRGLNPHIKDVTRRVAVEGFTALGVDCLSPLGGTPDDNDKGGSPAWAGVSWGPRSESQRLCQSRCRSSVGYGKRHGSDGECDTVANLHQFRVAARGLCSQVLGALRGRRNIGEE